MKKLNTKSNPWEKYYTKDIKEKLKYPSGSMVDYLLDSVSKYPEHTAYEYYKRQCSYRSFYEKIKDTAKSLKAQGVNENDKVAICMPSTPEALMMFYAVNMIGAIACMIHPLSAEKEIEDYINTTNATFLLTLDLVYEKIHNIADKTCISKIVISSASNNLKPIKKFLYKFKNRGIVPRIELTDNIMTWNEFLNYGYDYNKEYIIKRKKDDAAVILFSGGTSGKPKAILLSNGNFNALALTCHLMVEQSNENESILSILPIFHGFGLGVCIHTPLCCGAKVILIPTFSPKDFGKVILKNKPSIICAVPTLYESLIKEKMNKKALSFVKVCISGGDFMSSNLKERVDKYLKDHSSSGCVRVGYGLTECSAATCLTPTNHYKEGSIGVPFPDTQYKIVKPGTHIEANKNEEGEICISGPTVMIGYYNNIEETVKTLMKHDDGKVWLHTGDIGSMDEDGMVYFKQRLKRLIVSNGYNLYPSYIEDVLDKHPYVLTSCVVGVSHPKKNEVAKAYIVLEEGIKPSKEVEKELKRYCSQMLAKYSIPYYFEFRDSLPRTLVGKLAYKILEDENKKGK